jgi:NADH-quinone oxidoreductase subunit M
VTAVPPTAPWEMLGVCLLLLVAAGLGTRPATGGWPLALLAATLAGAIFAPSGPLAYVAVAVTAGAHTVAAMRHSRTGAVTLAVSGALALGAAAALWRHQLPLAFALSTLAIALRTGVLPFHGGVASLCDRVPTLHTLQLCSAMALVFVHLRWVDHHPAAAAAGPALVRYGAAAAIAGALLAIVQRDLRGFYRATTSMHGGMLLAALGAASLGFFAAALLVAVAMAMAVGGLGLMIGALEERVGPVGFQGPGGRGGAFPRLATAFALFGGAGVAMPGTAGFVADDLLLHALWMESPTSTVVVILASALLAVATLTTVARVFLGRTVPSLAPDLYPFERLAAVTIFLLLVALGVAPGLLLEPADAFLSVVPPA